MGIVTMITDFGDSDWFVGAVKSAILRVNPSCVIADVTHSIPRHDVRYGAYVLASVFRAFPPRTVHLAVVDPGVGSERLAIAAEIDGRYFVGPDNGLLSECLSTATYARFVRLSIPLSASATFHARDVFAPAAARLSKGCRIHELGEAVSSVMTFDIPHPQLVPEPGVVAGQVRHVDRFGNLITNLPNRLLELGPVYLQNRQLRKVSCYAEGGVREVVVLPGSNGTAEIAVNGGNAQEISGATGGTEVRVAIN
jgi:hypothetical protein